MYPKYLPVLAGLLFAAAAPPTVTAQEREYASGELERQIKSAMSAGPTSVSAEAAIVDWNLNQLRAGTNEWTCLPDRPDTPGNDPWCITEAWRNFLHAYVNQTEPTYSEIGFAYMLQGDTPVSNSAGPEPRDLEAVAQRLNVLRSTFLSHTKRNFNRPSVPAGLLNGAP